MEFLIILLCSFLLPHVILSNSVDSRDAARSIRDGETIVSASGIFELGFFSPGDTHKRYLGIWYKKSVKTVVWVANRETPLNDSSGAVKVTKQGILVLLSCQGITIWSSHPSKPARNPVVQLLDSGNLVVKDERDKSIIWQSFDYPCDTLLPSMKIGKDSVTGLHRYLSSWRRSDDPAPGNFTFGIDIGGFPEWVLKEGSMVRFRSGPWNGLQLSGMPEMRSSPNFKSEFYVNEKEVYYRYNHGPEDSSTLMRATVTQNGDLKHFRWIDETQGWRHYRSVQENTCDDYGLCGAYGFCSIDNSPVCSCLSGFVPKNESEWNKEQWLSGCMRKTPLNCSGDGFMEVSRVKLPDSRQSPPSDNSMNLDQCKAQCTNNCSCIAYANLNIRDGGTGCLLWFGELIDLKYSSGRGQSIYIRMAGSELDKTQSSGTNKSTSKKTVWIIVVCSVFLIVVLILVFLFWRKKHQKKMGSMPGPERSYKIEEQKEDLELPLFDFATIAGATNNFSPENKIGEGGFGSVYKGILEDGQEIAVKRLSKGSTQGNNEFKNEVEQIAKVQHRNLVKLLGCCIQTDEKALIYEFMPNKSLDIFIFDETRSMSLDWPMRYNIINGIARGLLYLHQDSRQRIIHRDLKAANVLLDKEMNAKISDFGLARGFGEKQTAANTSRVVGTYGYMSPEYAIDGVYSIKSDVFSFGVLVLEIVSGRRNRGFFHPDHQVNLVGHAWLLFTEGKPLELIAAPISDSCNSREIIRSIHVGLLCVQQSPDDRPTMSNVLLMLSSEDPLPRPKQPGFFYDRDLVEYSSSSSGQNPFLTNNFTITVLDAR